MKLAVAIIGISLLVVPLLRHASFASKAEEARNRDDLVSLLTGVQTEIMIGFLSLMILGFLCDGGKGYKPAWMLLIMTVLGTIWCFCFPGGWLLGIPLIVYSLEKLIRFVWSRESKANRSA